MEFEIEILILFSADQIAVRIPFFGHIFFNGPVFYYPGRRCCLMIVVMPSGKILSVQQRLPPPRAQVPDADALPSDPGVLPRMDLEREDPAEIDRVAVIRDRASP